MVVPDGDGHFGRFADDGDGVGRRDGYAAEHASAEPFGAVDQTSMLRGADESACSASVLCAALILRIQDADALWSVRTDVAKRLMSLRLSASDSSADVTDRVFRSLK